MFEVERAIKAYLDGGGRTGFGSRDSFRKYSGGGGAATFAKALAAAVKTFDDCPDSDTRHLAQLFGLICASAKA